MALKLGDKVFSTEDQLFFARISRDVNPMHMDPVAARRLITGRQVVHGIHVLLTALEHWRPGSAGSVASVSCNFNNPVSVGEKVVFSQQQGPADQWTLDATADGLLCARISLVMADPSLTPPPTGQQDCPPGTDPVLVLETWDQALDQPPEHHQGKRYALRLGPGDFRASFPHSYALLGAEGLASMVAYSYIVGMVCPGLHSVFSSLHVQVGAVPPDARLLSFDVHKYDVRFRLFDIRVGGVLQGEIKAFLRPPPQSQPSLKELSGRVLPAEFARTRSLVIGGSRGLGELTAKILAAGGGDVVVSFASGQADALAIVHEIEGSTLARAETVHLDLATAEFASAGIEWDSLDAIFFFATPRIFRKKAALFDGALFREFCEFYAARLYALCEFLESSQADHKVKIYVPSTVYIEERPKGMAEYAMAKAATELLALEINRNFKKSEVVCTRLPRLSTDQTSSILTLPTGSNVDVLLPVVRSILGR